MQLNEWLNVIYNKNIVKCKFLYLIFGILDKKQKSYYFEKIKNLCLTGNKNLIISFQHMVIRDPVLAIWLTDEPEKILKIFQETISEIIQDVFPVYFSDHSQIYIQISEMPINNTVVHLTRIPNNSLIKIKGIITSKSNAYSKLCFFKLTCLKCLEIQQPIFSTKNEKKNILLWCFNCRSNGPFQICNYHSLFSNFQKIGIREIDSGHRYYDKLYSKQIVLKGNFIDKFKLGEEIEVTGIIRYSTVSNANYPIQIPKFYIYIDANFVEKIPKCYKNIFFNTWEKVFISKIYKHKKIIPFLINSFSPELIIDKNIKLALVLSLFGGKLNKSISKLKIKQNINFLIVGQKGTGKTKFLDSIRHFLPKSIYINNPGFSLKGLTACLKFDNIIEDWIIEGGALVMADKGYCIIDQIDKLGSLERKCISEAIIHKKIFTTKNGFITHLDTRCSIIASATLLTNSLYSHISNLSFFEKNIWHEDYFSLFDVICVIKDIPDLSKDEEIGNSLLNFHVMNHPKNSRENKKFDKKKTSTHVNCKILNNPRSAQKLISKYITYTRYFIEPSLLQIDQNLISNLYTFIRKQIFLTGGVQMTLKYLESLLRLIESSARIHLRNKANSLDVRYGVQVMLNSFIEFQPINTKNAIEKKFKFLMFPYFTSINFSKK